MHGAGRWGEATLRVETEATLRVGIEARLRRGGTRRRFASRLRLRLRRGFAAEG